MSEAGAVAFTDGARTVVASSQVMRRALTYARDFGVLLMPHLEDADLVGDGVMNEGETASRLGLAGIPREAETVMLERDLRLVAPHRRALPRRHDLLRRLGRHHAPRQGGGAARHLRGLDQQPRR